MNMWLLVVWLTAVVGSNAAVASEVWDVTVEVAMPDSTLGPVRAEVDWLGDTVMEVLRDDGQGADHTAGDNLFSATFTGAPLRFLPITFSRPESDGWVSGHRSVEHVPWQGGRMFFGVTDRNTLTLQRLARPGTVEQVESSEQAWTAGGVVWAWLCLLFVLSLVPRHKTEPVVSGWEWGRGSSAAVWFGLAALWTWPGVIAGGNRAMGRHFDLSGTIWSLDAIPRLFPNLTDPLTAWPLGADYTAFDSFLLLPVGLLFQWVDPVRLHAWLGILGVGSSAWAAEYFARTVGARRPWSLIAGLSFGFSGLAATALLEGHVYHVVDPWLPLFAVYWWKACGPAGSNRHGLLAGLFFVLTLLTTAYLGVAASIVAIGFAIDGIRRREVRFQTLVIAATTVLPVLAALLWGIVDTADGPESTHRILLGSAQLSNISIGTPEIDRAGHSVAAGLGGVAFALTWLAHTVLRPGRWTVLFWTGVAALTLSFGPILALSPEVTLFPLPTYPLWSLPALGHIRFPIRLLWAWLLCSGVLAALVATALAEQRKAGWLVPLALLHAFVMVGLPLRQQSMLVSTPSAYASVERGAIFELMPTGTDPSGEFDNWMSATSCLYQTSHGNPIAEDCVSLPVQRNPRMKRARWVEDRLLEGQATLVQTHLEDAGFGGLAWHPDLYSKGDRARLAESLSGWSSVTKTLDGGEHIWLYPMTAREQPIHPTMADVPAKSNGANGGSGVSSANHVFVDLQIHYSPTAIEQDEGTPVPEWKTASYFVRTTQPNGIERSSQLTNDGTTVGDWQDDYTWTAMLTGPLPETLTMELMAIQSGTTTTLWQGTSQLTGDNDRLAFLLDNRTARPVNTGADRPAPPARRGSGLIALIGWLGWVALLGMWHIRRRRNK